MDRMNFAMWSQALRRMPRPTREQWAELDIVSRYLIATRAAVILMTFISAAIAGILAWRDGVFEWRPWILVTLGLMLAHATNNLINDYVDDAKGVDEDNYFRTQYGPQLLAQGYLTRAKFWAYMLVTGGAALAVGAVLVIHSGPPVLWLFGVGVFFVIFYTWPLKYLGLGEPTVLIVWGPLMVAGGYMVIAGEWNWNVAWASIPYALGVTSVLFGKHVDKLQADSGKKILTLPVLLGHKVSRYCIIGMMAAQYILIFALIGVGYLSPIMLICLYGLRPMYLVGRRFLEPPPAEPPEELPPGVWPLWYVALAFWYNARFGGLYLLGLLIDAGLTATGVSIRFSL
jgi:1,4-dihydroxy-2-naphthoate octaprenyltransferase